MRKTTTLLGAAALCLAAAAPVPTAQAEDLHTFRKIQLTDQFYSEGIGYADFNKDGKTDVVYGPHWYEGPDYKTKHEIYTPKTFDPKGYATTFFSFAYDFNNDGFADVLELDFPGAEARWWENPKGKDGAWTKHKVFDVVDNESPQFRDITGDGKPEIICGSKGFLGWVEVNWNDPTKPWSFHPISPKGKWHKYTHGIGFGDVNGDGKMDYLEPDGWWEQPKEVAADGVWKFHKFKFCEGAQMFVYDVNGDGKNDVVTSLRAHGFGLAWYEQVADPKEEGGIGFKRHMFMNAQPAENKYGVKFSQLHAVDLVDIDGDGLKDIVTGKRYWAHGPKGDDEPSAPAVLYWFKLVRTGAEVDFVPYRIDDNSGVGVDVVVADLNGDKLPDVLVGNKQGAFVHIHEKKTVSKAEWEQAQPKVFEGKIKTELMEPAAK